MNAQTEPHLFAENAIPVHDATALTAGGVQARIVLHGQVYALRITRAGKLILTK
ncbi:MAG: hemin uptake protein HemP [Paracoccaceae bacterium]